MSLMFLLNRGYGVEVTLPDKVHNFDLYSVGQVKVIL